MRRRELLLGAAAFGTQAPPAHAQVPGKAFKLGWLRPSGPSATEFQAHGIAAALQRLGWVEGQNLVIERRWSDGRVDRLPALARELAALRCDVVLAVGLSATRAAREAMPTVPIVFFGNFDPLATGLVDSLARPGGNLSGVLIAPDGTLAAKKMELLKTAVPRATRIAFLTPDDPAMQAQIVEARQAAHALDLELTVATVRGGDPAAAFATIAAERGQAVFVGAHTAFVTDRRPIIDLARRYRLPTMWEWPEQVRDGGLMAYGTSLTALYERVAHYLDRVFKGGRIGEMPIEQPSTFTLVVNAATARAIGLNLPRSLLLRADEVIE